MMTPESKAQLNKTIRALREQLLAELKTALESHYKLAVPVEKATLSVRRLRERERLEAWVDEQVRAAEGSAKKNKLKGTKDAVSARFWDEVVAEAAYTWLNRLVYLRLLEGHGLRERAVLAGGRQSRGYADFAEVAGELCREQDGYKVLLQVVFDELALDLPGLFGRGGLAALVPMPTATLDAVVEALDDEALAPCWDDDMTLGWVYQYWNDPSREALDKKLNDGGKVQPHEIASKTQMFTERYMVDWLLQNSLGPTWLAMCKKHGWTPACSEVLGELERRREEWRAKRAAGDVELTELMPLHSDMERRWAYYVPQPIPEDAVVSAPMSVRDIKLLDPAVGSGHFLVVAFDLLVALYREEAKHRGEEGQPQWSDKAVVERIVEHNLRGIDLDPRAVQIAAAALWLKGQRVSKDARPNEMGLVAAKLSLGALPEDDPALVELRAAVQRDTGIPAEMTDEVVAALRGADHLGSLLKVGDVLADIVTRHALEQATPEQGGLFGEAFSGEQTSIEVAPEVALPRLVARLEAFLSAHSSSADLGLRLRGQQLAAGVRFLRVVREGQYDLVVGNPPYQGTSKMADAGYVKKQYPRGKADLYAAFLERGLELVREGGTSAMITMRNWMFIKQYAGLREWLLETFDLRALHDLSSGAFEEINPAQVVVTVTTSVFRRAPMTGANAVALKVFDDETVTQIGETQRKRAATLAHEGRHEFAPAALKVVPEWPLVYWWSPDFLRKYDESPSVGSLTPLRNGLSTQDNVRFLRFSWETPSASVLKEEGDHSYWAPYVKGAEGREWFEDVRYVVNWKTSALELYVWIEDYRIRIPGQYTKSEEYYFVKGCAFSMIGASFSGRLHRRESVFGHMGASAFPPHANYLPNLVCLFNSRQARGVLSSLNPSTHFLVGDVARLPYLQVPNATDIVAQLDTAFTLHESHREPSVEFTSPGPSPWRHAQDWAQLAVDRPENTPLPEYVEELDPEPPTDHISFALGLALGRFDGAAIVDPTTDDLSAALPHGTLFLDGTLDPDSTTDALGLPACAPLHAAWATHASAIDTKRKHLRDYLRLDFFSVHKSMYENRPIHWPLSSPKKTFVAWVNIHRWHANTLRALLGEHLKPALARLQGRIEDLQAALASGDTNTARKADKDLPKVKKHEEELQAFIDAVAQCAEHGPPPPDAKTPPRETDAPYDPDLDDGVMVNSSALYPILEAQWKDPKKWWKELANAKGRKDYDWSHLAAKYFPARVDAKCKEDPSLGVAHGCFWKYHPERAYAWELRLQDEIEPGFTIDEDGSDEARAAFEEQHPDTVQELRDKEAKRRERKKAKAEKKGDGALFRDE